VSPVDKVPRDFPHAHGSARTWVRDGDTRYIIICSFCRSPLGCWDYTKISDKKAYPEDQNAKFSLKQKQSWK
jgi:hypothetical protein